MSAGAGLIRRGRWRARPGAGRHSRPHQDVVDEADRGVGVAAADLGAVAHGVGVAGDRGGELLFLEGGELPVGELLVAGLFPDDAVGGSLLVAEQLLRVRLGDSSNASSVGVKTVMSLLLSSVSTSSAFFTAPTGVESPGGSRRCPGPSRRSCPCRSRGPRACPPCRRQPRLRSWPLSSLCDEPPLSCSLPGLPPESSPLPHAVSGRVPGESGDATSDRAGRAE